MSQAATRLDDIRAKRDALAKCVRDLEAVILAYDEELDAGEAASGHVVRQATLPGFERGEPVATPPPATKPWVPTATADAIIVRIQREGDGARIAATERRALRALRAHGYVEPGALALTVKGEDHAAEGQ